MQLAAELSSAATHAHTACVCCAVQAAPARACCSLCEGLATYTLLTWPLQPPVCCGDYSLLCAVEMARGCGTCLHNSALTFNPPSCCFPMFPSAQNSMLTFKNVHDM